MIDKVKVNIGEEKVYRNHIKAYVTYNHFDRSDPELGLLYFNLHGNLCWSERPQFYLE